MASLITCTPGGESDNSYIDLTDADAYFADTLREERWEGYTADDREKALIQATAMIEAQGGERLSVNSPRRRRFVGSPYDVDIQSLHFPRTIDVSNDDGVTLLVPVGVRSAVCEQAWFLLWKRDNPDLIDRADLQRQGVRSASVAGVSESYAPASVPVGIGTDAWQHIKPFIRRMWGTA